MKIVGFVPLRSNSKRLKNKNMLPLFGKPLYRHIIDAAVSSTFLDHIYIYSSQNNYTWNELPSKVSWLARPKSLDSDQTLGIEIYQMFVNQVNADIYVLLHATSPFLLASTLDCGIKKVVEENYDSAFTVKKHQTFAWYKDKPVNYSLNNIPRTQDLDPVFIETSGAFIFTNSVIKDLKRRIGNNPFLIEVGYEEAIDIDTYEDFELAKLIKK